MHSSLKMKCLELKLSSKSKVSLIPLNQCVKSYAYYKILDAVLSYKGKERERVPPKTKLVGIIGRYIIIKWLIVT